MIMNTTDQTDRSKIPGKTHDLLHFLSQQKLHGECIVNISSSLCYVYNDSNINVIADELINYPSTAALGVVSRTGELLGMISRKNLFSMLGKQYGRDLYKTKSVNMITTSVPVIYYKDNILNVAEEYSSYLREGDIYYFLLNDEENHFAGIFSTSDILIYLSDITQKDIQLARRLQSSIINDEKIINTQRFEMAGAALMAKKIGGDFYAMEKITESRWAIMLCDVAGKGISASLVSTTIGGMVSIYDFSQGILNFITKLNNYIYDTFGGEQFITGVFIEFDELSGKIVYYDAGHSYSFIFRENKFFKVKNFSSNIPLGINHGYVPQKGILELEGNDLLILCTDGLEEQINPVGTHYGVELMARTVYKNRKSGLKKIKDEVVIDFNNFRKNQVQHDDVTFVMLDYKGNVD